MTLWSQGSAIVIKLLCRAYPVATPNGKMTVKEFYGNKKISWPAILKRTEKIENSSLRHSCGHSAESKRVKYSFEKKYASFFRSSVSLVSLSVSSKSRLSLDSRYRFNYKIASVAVKISRFIEASFLENSVLKHCIIHLLTWEVCCFISNHVIIYTLKNSCA